MSSSVHTSTMCGELPGSISSFNCCGVMLLKFFAPSKNACTAASKLSMSPGTSPSIAGAASVAAAAVAVAAADCAVAVADALHGVALASGADASPRSGSPTATAGGSVASAAGSSASALPAASGVSVGAGVQAPSSRLKAINTTTMMMNLRDGFISVTL